MADVNPDDLTQRMIDQGARMLAEEGLAGLSLRRLATACGTSTMAVYTRFGDKPRLLAAMYREGFRRLGDRLRDAAVAAEPLTSLAALGRAYRMAALDGRYLYGLMFGTRPRGFEPDQGDQEAAAATYSPLVDGVRTAVEQGILAGDPDRIALHLWVVAHGMISLELSGHLGMTDQAASTAFDEALGLAVTPFLVPTH